MKKFTIVMFAVVCFHLLFFSLLVGPAELDGGDDMDHLAISNGLSWASVFDAFIFIRPSTSATGEGVVDHALGNRVGQTLSIKIQHHFFGSDPSRYYLFQALIGALCAVLIAYLVMLLTGSLTVAVLAGIFYGFMPPVFLSEIWFSDFSEMIHLCTLIAAVCVFFWCQRRERGMKPGGLDIFIAAFWAFACIYASKSKPSGLAIPIIAGAFYLVCLIRSKRWRYWGLTFFITGLILALTLTSKGLLKYDWSNVFQMVFQNGANEFEIEKTSAFFDWSSVLPVSLARNLGFFLLWLSVISAVVIFSKTRGRFSIFSLYLSVWFLSEVALYGFAGNAPRYLSDALIPLSILLALLYKHVWRSIRGRPMGWFFIIFFTIGYAFQIGNNFQHLLFLRDWKIGYFQELNVPVQIILNDLRGREHGERVSPEDYVYFAHRNVVDQMRAAQGPDFFRDMKPLPRFEDVVVYNDVVDLPHQLPVISRNSGHHYAISYKSLDPTTVGGPSELLARIPRVPGSTITNFVKQFKKIKNDGYIWVYRSAQ